MNLYVIFGKKSIAALLSAAVLMTAVLISGAGIRDNASVSTSAEVNWGLSYQNEGSPPTGNASAEELKKYNAVFTGDTSAKKIYLTFDAGYENGFTADILDILNCLAKEFYFKHFHYGNIEHKSDEDTCCEEKYERRYGLGEVVGDCHNSSADEEER